MKTFMIRLAAVATLSLFTLSANAATLIGTFLDSNRWTLVHDSATPGNTAPADFLRWDPGQTIMLDLTGSILSAGGPQEYNLTSDNGATATFTLLSASFDLSGANGFAGGTLDYTMDVTGGPMDGSFAGTFTFAEASYGNSPFNSSTLENGKLSLYGWAGDEANGIGIDIAFSAQVPIPAPLLLFASGLMGLGLLRRRS